MNDKLKKKLLSFVNGMTPLHYAINYSDTFAYMAVLKDGNSVGVLEEMLSQKLDVSLAEASLELYNKFRPGFNAFDYMVEQELTGRHFHFERLFEINSEVAYRMIAAYRTHENGSLLHSDFLLPYVQYLGKKIEAFFQDSFDAIALVQDQKGQNFLMKHFETLVDEEFDFAEYLGSIDSKIASSLLAQIDNNGDSLATFVFAKCPLEQSFKILENDSLSGVFKDMLLRKNFNNQSAVHLFARTINASNVDEVSDRHVILEDVCAETYRTQLTEKDNSGEYPIVGIFRGMMRHQVDPFVRESTIIEYLKRCGDECPASLEKMLTVKGDGGHTVLHCFDAIEPSDLLFFLAKLPSDKLEDVLCSEHLPGRSILFQLVSLHGPIKSTQIEQLMKKVDYNKVAQCLSYIAVDDKFVVFQSFPFLFRALYLAPSETGEETQLLLKKPVHIKAVMLHALTHHSNKYINEIIENVSKDELTKFLGDYARLKIRVGAVPVQHGRFLLIINHVGLDRLKQLVNGLGDSLGILLYEIAYSSPRDFLRIFELVDDQNKKAIIVSSGWKILIGALQSGDDELIKYLLKSGFKPRAANLVYAIETENWSAYHLFSPKISSSDVINIMDENFSGGVRSLLSMSPEDSRNRKFFSCLTHCVKYPCNVDVDEKGNLRRLLAHASRHYDVYKKDRNLAKVVNEKTIQAFSDHFPDDTFIFDIDKDARLALYNKLHQTAFGMHNHILVKNFTDDVDTFLMNFLCRVVTSKLPVFRSGIGAVMFEEHDRKRFEDRLPLLLSVRGVREGRRLANRLTVSPENPTEESTQAMPSSASPRQPKV